MRKRLPLILLLLTLCTLPAGNVFAVPAAPEIHTLQQPDGGVFTARQWGDERRAGWETEEGFTVLFDAELDGWTYAEPDGHGDLVSSGRRADREMPPAHVNKRLRPRPRPGMDRPAPPLLRRHAANSSTSDTQATLTAAPPLEVPPATETGYLPIILVNFSDTTQTYTAQNFSDLLFGTGTWSMKDYYEEVSSGRFTVSPGPAGVVGWVTANNTHDYYGRQVGNNTDTWPGDLVYEAVQQADAAIDFSAYDFDGDCYADTVAIIHQGTGQEASGKSSDIWSHSWSLAGALYWGNSHYGPYTTNDTCRTNPARKVVVDNYIIQPEKFGTGITTVGVFAHEYGHALGLPDLYDTDGSSEGVGNWSLMASGSWTGVSRGGDRPAHLDPWSKYVLGWITPVKLAAPALARSVAAVETGGEVLQFLDGSPTTGVGEYFLLENRHQTGFDYALPGFGLMLWHIDESWAGNDFEWYPGCTACTGHYQVAVVPADNLYHLEKSTNRGDAGDPFPGSANRQAISSSTSPNSNLYSGAASGLIISNISAAGGVMSADIAPPDTTPPVTTIAATPPLLANSGSGSFNFSANESATFSCRLDATAWSSCTAPYPFAGLADGSHTFTVRATDLSANQETSPPAYSWMVDTSPPETTITTTPANPAVTGSGSFSFSTNEAGASFTCSLDSGNWTLCTSPYGFSGLADGNHTFSVLAIDPAGNVDPTPATHAWTITTTVQPNVKLSAAGQLDSYFGTISATLAALPAGVVSSLRTQPLTFAESLVLNRCEVVVMSGSYYPGFTIVSGPTIVRGTVTITCGTMIVEQLTIM